MSEHEYEHRRTEQRRAEGNAGRRYGRGSRRTGGRQGGRSRQQSGRTEASSPEYPDQQSSRRFSQGQSGPQSSHQRGGQSQQTGGGTGWQTGQQPSQRTGGQSSQQTGGRTGWQSGQQGGQQPAQQTTRGVGQQSQRQTPIKPVSVRDIAATDVVTVGPDAAVTEIVDRMANEDVGAVVVVRGNRPEGIVTDRRIALALGESADVSRMRASDLMTEDPFTVSEDTNVFELARQLGDEGVRRVPVVDDRGELRGIVSLDDAIVLLAEEFYNLSQIVRKQSPRF